MRRLFGIVLSATALVVAVGCNTPKQHDLRQPHVEEFNPPPEEARYNNPPEEKYRKRIEVKDQAAKMGNSSGMGTGPGLGASGVGGR